MNGVSVDPITMDKPVAEISPGKPPPVPPLRLDRILTVVWGSAVEAFVLTILICVFGRVAMALVGGIWNEMTPSMPPAFAPKPLPEAETRAQWNPRPAFEEHGFGILFGIILFVKVWNKLAGRTTTHGRMDSRPSRTQRMGKRLFEGWFKLIVGNAFGALLSAALVVWIQEFSYRYWIRHWIFESALSGFQNVANTVLGSGRIETIGRWSAWYGENQFKFTFWLLYLAVICDDLGLPNLKTLGKWTWRRFRKGCQKRNLYG